MQQLANEIRQKYGLLTPRVLKSDLRRIYRDHEIKIDYWHRPLKKLRGAYFFDPTIGASVLLRASLPDDPLIFTMAHELKHHLVDRELGVSYCDPSNDSTIIEIGAEVFAAELLFPEADFASLMKQFGIGLGECTPRDIVRVKRETKTTLSYAGLTKRAVRLRFATQTVLANVQWKKLEEQIYGEPVYKKIQRLRRANR